MSKFGAKITFFSELKHNFAKKTLSLHAIFAKTTYFGR